MHTQSPGRRKALLGRWIVLAALLAFSLGSTSPARALVVCFVDDTAIGPTHDGSSWTFAYTSLQTALSACAGGQIWVAAGVYKPGATQTDSFSIPPGTQVYGGFAGTEADVNLRNLIANPTILSGDIDNNDAHHLTTNIDLSAADISGSNSFHVVKMDAFYTAITSTTVLDSFVITGGDSSDDYDGGGLLCLSNGAGRPCSPNLNALSFSGNRARYGGGLALYGGGAGGVSSPNVTFSYFLGNSAAWSGGAVFNDGSYGGTSNPWFGWVTFEDNQAVNNYAGALYNFAENGGIANPTIFAVGFLNNTAGMLGGAVFNDGGGGTSSPWFSLVTFAGNDAGQLGGAVYSSAYDSGSNQGVSSPVFSNVTFSENGHTGGGFVGGALYNDGSYGGVSSPTLKNVTFNANSADSGGAMRNHSDAGTSGPILTNVIMWGDIASWKPEIENTGTTGPTPTIAHSVIQGSGGSGGSWDSLLGADAGNNLDADPMLASLAGNWTMALNPGSSAIDAGDDTICTTLPVGSVDQRLVARPQGPHCDIGAYEVDYAAHVFADMPVVGKEWMESWVNAFYYAGITTGCGSGPLVYCPESPVTRAAMAVFILRAKHGADDAPPAATHTFSDMPVAGKEWMEPWVDQLYAEGITTGCGVSPLTYCPESAVNRGAMAVFLLRAIHGSGYTPPAASGVFSDVPVAGKEWMEPWIIQFYNEGITTGCGAAPLIYCPENSVTRASMAVFVDRAYGLYP